MHPKLKPDAYWVPHEEGVTFVHVTGYLTVSGRSSLELMNRLAPYLDGNTALDDLVAGLDDGKRAMVTTLVMALADAGLVKDVGGDEPHGLSAAELETYGHEIAYVDHFLDSAAARFERYRATAAVCVGAGYTISAAVHACLASGIRDVHLLVTGQTDTDRVREHAAEAAARDAAQTVAIADAGTDPGSALVAALDATRGAVVLHATDVPAPALTRTLDRLCRARGVLFVPAAVTGDVAWTGPVVDAGSAGWESVWLRRAALTDGPAGRPVDPGAGDPEPAGRSPWLAGPTASIVGNRVAFSAFRAVTGIAAVDRAPGDVDGDVRERLSRVDLETLVTTEHRAHAHPGAGSAPERSAADLVAGMAAFHAAAAPDGPDFSRGAATLVDPAVGVLAELDEEEMTQLPLCVAAMRVSDPFRLLDTTAGGPSVVGAGDDVVAARYAAARAALTAYAALAVDPRTLPADPATGVWAHDLVADTPVQVPAALVHPVLAHDGPASAWHRPVGLRSGVDAADALQGALGDHVAALTVAELGAGGAATIALAPGALDSLPEPAARHAKLLRIAQADAEVRRAVGTLGVPVYIGRLADRIVAASVDPVEAVTGLLLAHQGHAEATFPVPAWAAGPDVHDGPLDPVPGWRALAAALAAAGHTPVARPGCDDPVVTELVPTVVQVALWEAGRG